MSNQQDSEREFEQQLDEILGIRTSSDRELAKTEILACHHKATQERVRADMGAAINATLDELQRVAHHNIENDTYTIATEQFEAIHQRTLAKSNRVEGDSNE